MVYVGVWFMPSLFIFNNIEFSTKTAANKISPSKTLLRRISAARELTLKGKNQTAYFTAWARGASRFSSSSFFLLLRAQTVRQIDRIKARKLVRFSTAIEPTNEAAKGTRVEERRVQPSRPDERDRLTFIAAVEQCEIIARIAQATIIATVTILGDPWIYYWILSTTRPTREYPAQTVRER